MGGCSRKNYLALADYSRRNLSLALCSIQFYQHPTELGPGRRRRGKGQEFLLDLSFFVLQQTRRMRMRPGAFDIETEFGFVEFVLQFIHLLTTTTTLSTVLSYHVY